MSMGNWQQAQSGWHTQQASPIGSYSGAWAGKVDRADRKCDKYTAKAAQNKRCGFPPSRAKCHKLREKHCGKVETFAAEQMAAQQLFAATDPQAAADAVNQAAAANIQAVRAESNSTPYIIGGVVLLASVVGAGVLIFGGK